MATWVLDSIEVTGGFLGGLSLQFPKRSGLICVIGPRGSGKSTLTEAIRYGMGEATAATKTRTSLVDANLGSSSITIRTIDRNNASYIANRRPKQKSTVMTPEGQLLKDVDLERGTFLPLDAYSSVEIESIADESLGEKRRSLIDALQGPQYGEMQLRLSDLRRSLDANADKIRDAQGREKDLTERIEELKGARGKLDALPRIDASGDDAKLFARASEQRAHNKRETQAINAVLARYANLENAVKLLDSEQIAPLLKFSGSSESSNWDILEQTTQSIHGTVNTARRMIDELVQAIGKGVGDLRQLAQNLAKAHSAQEQSFQNLQGKNESLTQQLQQRSEAEQAVATLVEHEVAREEVRKSIVELIDVRAKLKGTYLLERGNISMIREDITKQLERGLGKRVRLRVLRNADNTTYKTMLLDGLRGARVRNHEDILTALLQMRPEQLAEVIQQQNVGELNAQASLGEERCRKILEAFHTSINPFDLEVVDIDDRIAIELNVGSERDVNFKDAAELSRGQKCTALLPLLLARRDTPLVIDQPEDNLDNHYIYETIVNTIKNLKSKRQMIFVTHNANIPVLGEADLVVVMDSDGRRGFVSKVGTVDECRREIIDLLEGGREAFEKRRQRYER